MSGSNSDTFVQESPTSGYIEFRQDALFPVGSSGGNVNVTEVGAAFRTIVDNLIPLCSRALVVDGEGNPTAFEWLEDEELLLTAFHRRYISLEDVVLTDVPVDGDGPDQTITIRPSALGTLVRWGWPGDFGVQPGFHAYWGENYALPPDHLVNSTGSSSGAGAGNANQSNAEITTGTEPYVPGSKQRTRWGQVNTGSDRNVVGVAFLGAASAQSTGARAFGQWCIKLDPGIPKSSLHRFRIGLTFKIDNTP